MDELEMYEKVLILYEIQLTGPTRYMIPIVQH